MAPGTGVWDRRHWQSAGLMPRLTEAVDALPMDAEILVTEAYPGAAAHTVLLVRPDGHLVTTLSGVRPAEMAACANAVRGRAYGGEDGQEPGSGRARRTEGAGDSAGSRDGGDGGAGGREARGRGADPGGPGAGGTEADGTADSRSGDVGSGGTGRGEGGPSAVDPVRTSMFHSEGD